MRRCCAIIGGLILLLTASAALAQDLYPRDYRVFAITAMHAASEDSPVAALDDSVLPTLLPPQDTTLSPVPARMSPELALSTYLVLAKRQLAELGAYSDVTTIEADLPDTAQHGRFELRRYFQAPRSLAFAALHFAGDGFVKTNVITRLLQSEVDHVQKGEGSQTAITADNYKFSYKGAETSGRSVAYIYQVKPRHKRPGLFKGRILVDAATGRLRRAEGQMVKSPSFFVKKIEFVQEYGECGQFSLPVHIHSEARTRLVGRAVVEMFHSDYRAITVAELQAASRSSASGVGGSSSN
jgi:hypothetical protein